MRTVADLLLQPFICADPRLERFGVDLAVTEP